MVTSGSLELITSFEGHVIAAHTRLSVTRLGQLGRETIAVPSQVRPPEVDLIVSCTA